MRTRDSGTEANATEKKEPDAETPVISHPKRKVVIRPPRGKLPGQVTGASHRSEM